MTLEWDEVAGAIGATVAMAAVTMGESVGSLVFACIAETASTTRDSSPMPREALSIM